LLIKGIVHPKITILNLKLDMLVANQIWFAWTI